MAIELVSEHACFGGVQGFYRMASPACGGPMRFAVFQPPQARAGRVPVLYFLAGLTCSEETATIKAGAQRVAAELGLMLVMPDTGPRDTASMPAHVASPLPTPTSMNHATPLRVNCASLLRLRMSPTMITTVADDR